MKSYAPSIPRNRLYLTVPPPPEQIGIAAPAGDADQPRPAQPFGQPTHSPWAAACGALFIVVLCWTFGYRPHPSHHLARAIAHIAGSNIWDNHQDLARSSIAALAPPAYRRTPHSPTRIAVPSAAFALPPVAYRRAEEGRPVTLSPHIAQIRLRAPPVLA